MVACRLCNDLRLRKVEHVGSSQETCLYVGAVVERPAREAAVIGAQLGALVGVVNALVNTVRIRQSCRSW